MQTFVAVIIGAALATLGGFAATQVGIWIERARRARSAALLSGEILAAVGLLLRLAEEAALKDTILDPLASRFLRAARREIEVYDRNRELLFNLDDADLRARLHSFIVRLSISLDRLADNHTKYAELCSIIPIPHQQMELLQSEMDNTFKFLTKSQKLIPDLLVSLQPFAKNRFDNYSRINNEGLPIESSL